MDYVASECDPNEYSSTALVIASPQWFKEYKGEPVYVSQFSPTGYIGFKAVLQNDVSPGYWIDPNKREHKWFRYERLIPDRKKARGVIRSTKWEGNATIRMEVLCEGETTEEFFCRTPISAASERDSQWVANRKVIKEGKKTRVPDMNPLLLVGEFCYGGGPIGRLARACDGFKKLDDLKGMQVNLFWADNGVCDLFPLADT